MNCCLFLKQLFFFFFWKAATDKIFFSLPSPEYFVVCTCCLDALFPVESKQS